MKKRLLFFLFLYSNVAIAQDDFRKGFILQAVNDTIHGFINYRENRSNFQSCEFKKDLAQATTTSYEPGQLFGYGFIGERYYQAKDVQLPDSSRKKVFLEVLVKGKITLYKLKEKGYYDLFYIEKEKDFYLVNSGLPRKQGEPRKQLGILNYTMFDCPGVQRKTANVEPDEESLVKITQEYNACMGGATTTYKDAKKWIAFTPLFTPGIAFSMLEINATGPETWEGKYEISIGAVISGGFDVSLPRTRERLVLHLEIAVMPTEY